MSRRARNAFLVLGAAALALMAIACGTDDNAKSDNDNSGSTRSGRDKVSRSAGDGASSTGQDAPKRSGKAGASRAG